MGKRDAPVSKQEQGATPAKRRVITAIICAVFAIILSTISCMLMLARVPNMHVVAIIVTGLSALLIIYLAIWTLGAYERHKKLAKILKRCYISCLTVGIIVFSVLLGMIISGTHTDETDADCLIILGAGLRGEVPSMMLRMRLDAAAQYIERNGDIPIIVTGGQGPGETITEAEAMKRYLVSTHGMDGSLIIMEDTSTRTKENIENAIKIMDDYGFDTHNIKVAIVTNEFHLYRAKLIAKNTGLEAAGIAAPTPGIYLKILYFFRETISLAREFIL